MKAKETKMKSVSQECRFCGQMKMLQVPEDYTESQISDEIAMKCRCKESKGFRQKKEREERIEIAKNNAKQAIEDLFKDERYLEARQIMSMAVDMEADWKIEQMTVKINDRTKGIVKRTSDSIVVRREDKDTIQQETDIL